MGFLENFNGHLPAMLDQLGQVATYTPETGSPFDITGIFENEYFEIPGQSVGVVGSQPKFTYASPDIPNPKENDALTIGSDTYRVVIVMPDGAGVTTLILEKNE